LAQFVVCQAVRLSAHQQQYLPREPPVTVLTWQAQEITVMGGDGAKFLRAPVSEVIPFPAGDRDEPIGDIVALYDQDLQRAAIAILDEAFDAGGHALVARLTARLFVSIGYTYGENTLLDVLDEMAAQ
jgi:hypothetical protein